MRKCIICERSEKETIFPKAKQRCVDCINIKRCYICKEHKELNLFMKDSSKTDGYGNRCKNCSNKRSRNKTESFYKRKRIYDRKRNKLPSRKMRSFIHDCFRRLKRYKNPNVKELGFTKDQFLSKFPTIPTGFHIDHCIPLSWFMEECPINISCNLHNLQLLDSFVNNSKKNIFCHKPSDNQYLISCLPYIKNERLVSVKNLL